MMLFKVAYGGFKKYCDTICGKILDQLSNQELTADKVNVQSSIAIIFLTSPLMWAYTIIAYLYMSHPLPFWVGLMSSIIHISALFLFKRNINSFLVATLGLAGGYSHQVAFSFFSGGFNSFTIIWLAVLPLLGGLMNGRRGALLWGSVTFITSIFIFVLHLNNFEFPNYLSKTGSDAAKLLMLLGWIGLSTFLVIAQVQLQNNHRKQLEEKNAYVEQLLRVLYHDLATPLSTSILNLEQVLKKPDDEKTKNRLLRVRKSIQNMLDITTNIRELQALETHKKDVELTQVDLSSILQDLHYSFVEQLKSKSLNLTLEIHPNYSPSASFHSNHEFSSMTVSLHNTDTISGISLPKVFVLAEPISFKNQVLGNLVSNAIKFSHPNSEIRIQLFQIDDRVLIKVKDSGVGIPSEMIPKIFSTNEKTSRQGTAGENGTGFGMPVVKTFVEIYGGTISVESNESGPTKGTTFILDLKSAA